MHQEVDPIYPCRICTESPTTAKLLIKRTPPEDDQARSPIHHGQQKRRRLRQRNRGTSFLSHVRIATMDLATLKLLHHLFTSPIVTLLYLFVNL